MLRQIWAQRKPMFTKKARNKCAVSPTNCANILDLVLTNMHNFYESKPAVLLPPFSLSDHNAVAVWPKTKVSTSTPSRKIVIKRDEIHWHLIELQTSCDEKCKFLFCNYDWLPHSHAREMSGDSTDLPSMEELKHLITLCRCALNLNNFLFKFHWKKVNRMRKSF